ncbi:MAG TPA: TonB family protein [Terriglobales bacterium]|jgi:periplasmic protein TonB|nr:TonB family protein [Terriglobales bacterium]
MGYQALLFSPDEKLARVVSQVFTELDFTVEPAHEPFGAVKKLMVQRYDAIVVDCDNEQNASLLFKSARNSNFNQSSLAIALVEGQAGVANAYRIGANLVLTKPINVEQAKGTLRVARGLLRKNSDAAGGVASGAGPAMPSRTAPVPGVSSSQPASRGAAAIAPPPSRPGLPEFEAPLSAEAPPHGLPAMSASSKVDDKPPIPAPTAQNRITMPAAPAVPARQSVAASALAQNTSSAFTSSGSAAAPAPAKKVTAPPAKENRAVESESARRSHDGAPMLSSLSVTDIPSFSSLGEEEDSGASGGRKKIIIAAVIIVALAVLGYFSYGNPGKSSTATPAPQTVSTPQDSGKQDSEQPAPALAPMSSPKAAPSASTPNRASSTTQTSASKAATATLPDMPSPGAGNPPVIRIPLEPGLGTKKPDSAPLLVKSNPAGTKTQAQSQESAPPLPSPLAVASAAVTSNDSALSGLLSSASSSLSKPSLATARVSQGVSQGLLIKRVQPRYPQAALAVHAQGAVQIEATINKEGSVTNLKVLSGDPILARAALEAVRQWRYKPYYLDGEPIEIQTDITVNFKAN